MNLITGIKIHNAKLKHTGFAAFQIIVILSITAALDGYYLLYSHKSELQRLRLIYDFIAVFTPVICSISIAWQMRQDEQVSNMFGLLAVKNRMPIIGGPLLIAWGCIVAQLFVQTLSLSLLIPGVSETETLRILLLLFAGMSVYTLFFCVFHLFLQLRFGIGISVFWGVFECMQMIAYSNIKLAGGFRYVPSAWISVWQSAVFESELVEHWQMFATYLVILVLMSVSFFIWFGKWEGKNNE